MGVYILTPCLLENIENKRYLTEVLYKFIHENLLKVGLDSCNKIIEKYYKIASVDPGIASWLAVMSYNPSAFEKVNIPSGYPDADDIELYVKVSTHVLPQKRIIVKSHQTLCNFNYTDGNYIEYGGHKIKIFDRDEAIEELSEKQYNINVSENESCQINIGNGEISKSKIR